LRLLHWSAKPSTRSPDSAQKAMARKGAGGRRDMKKMAAETCIREAAARLVVFNESRR